MGNLKEIFFGKTGKLLVVFLMVFFVIIWNPHSILGSFRNIFFTVTYPIQIFFSTSADKIFYFTDTVAHIDKLKKENEKLTEENLKLISENSKLKDIRNENEILRKELKLLPRDKFSLVSAHIIGRNFYGGNDWILIDKGKASGIKKNMPVIVGGGVLIGKVSEVFSYSSKIVVITNSNITISATTVETGAMGIVKSKYGLGTVLDMVVQTDYLKKGDSVITSEINKNIPRGLFIGNIQEIRSSGDQLFRVAILSLPVNLQKLRFVFVITNKK